MHKLIFKKKRHLLRRHRAKRVTLSVPALRDSPAERRHPRPSLSLGLDRPVCFWPDCTLIALFVIGFIVLAFLVLLLHTLHLVNPAELPGHPAISAFL